MSNYPAGVTDQMVSGMTFEEQLEVLQDKHPGIIDRVSEINDITDQRCYTPEDWLNMIDDYLSGGRGL